MEQFFGRRRGRVGATQAGFARTSRLCVLNHGALPKKVVGCLLLSGALGAALDAPASPGVLVPATAHVLVSVRASERCLRASLRRGSQEYCYNLQGASFVAVQLIDVTRRQRGRVKYHDIASRVCWCAPPFGVLRDSRQVRPPLALFVTRHVVRGVAPRGFAAAVGSYLQPRIARSCRLLQCGALLCAARDRQGAPLRGRPLL